MPLIEAHNLSRSYGPLQVLKNVSLSVEPAEVVSIVGASGAGKSTLLHILGTLDRPQEGKLMLEEKDVFSLNDNKLSSLRNKRIGFVFQQHRLLPEFTALENVCLPALIAGEPMRDAEKRAHELLNTLNISARAHHKPNELSGGEQQRVAVARALINNPAVVLADEPSGNLDSAHAAELHRLFFTLREARGQCFVLVTHNEELAAMADRKLTMADGALLG